MSAAPLQPRHPDSIFNEGYFSELHAEGPQHGPRLPGLAPLLHLLAAGGRHLPLLPLRAAQGNPISHLHSVMLATFAAVIDIIFHNVTPGSILQYSTPRSVL